MDRTDPGSSPDLRENRTEGVMVALAAIEKVWPSAGIDRRYLEFYNGRHPHSSLDGRAPDQAYFTPQPLRMAA